MSDKPFFEQLDDLDALIAEANEPQHERSRSGERPREQRPEQDIPASVRTVRAMRNRRRVIE